jgi:hypothetical protein
MNRSSYSLPKHFESERELKGAAIMKSEMPKKSSPVISVLAGMLSLLPLPLAAQQIDRTVLPIAEPNYPRKR